MKTVAFATIQELQELLASKQLSPQELLAETLQNFKKYDPTIGSALEVFDADSIIKASAQQGPLYAIPGLIKDNICQKDRIASCASKILENFEATYDATAITRLKQSGAFLVGRANMDEFAMGSSTETSAFQKTVNPWNHDRVPGGSSGGSIAAVAAGLVPWALGSETGGSVRQPAAFCGIVGYKPTYGLISRYGLIAYASSLDQIGIATRTAYDCATVLSCIAGITPEDSTSIPATTKDYTQLLDGKLPKNMTIGVIDTALEAEGIAPEVKKSVEDAIATFEKMGATIKRISIPMMDYSAAIYFILSRAEAASNLSRFDGVKYGLRDKSATTLKSMYTNTRQRGFGTEVKARILVGNYVLSAGHAGKFYINAQRLQQALYQEFTDAFKEVDLLIAPTHPAPAFKFNAFSDNKLEMDLQDYFTCGMNIVGIPAISVPCGFSSENLPIGFQIIGPRNGDQLILQAAHAYQQNTEWHLARPKM